MRYQSKATGTIITTFDPMSFFRNRAYLDWELIIETSDPTPAVTFGNLSDADQGALLLAKNRGLRIEYWHSFYSKWIEKGGSVLKNDTAYRIAPARITGTVETINGEPDFTTWEPTK